MKLSFPVGRLLGFPVYVHVSILLIVPLFAYAFATAQETLLSFPLGFGGLGLPFAEAYLLGLGSAVALFVCILLHEVGHSLVARRYGVPIDRITLWIFGGVSSMEEIPREPRLEERIALMGPATSAILGVLFLGTEAVLRASIATGPTATLTFLSLLGFYNLSLAGFNLIPAFPMDGGRILRAVFARRMGFVRATDRAAEVGKGFAVVFGILGIFQNPWLIFLAFFLYMAAAEEEKATRLTVSLEGISVTDIMEPQVATVGPDVTISQLLDRMLKEKRTGFPVVEAGRVVGMVGLADTEKVPAEAQGTTAVGQIMRRQFPVLPPSAEAMDALKALSRANAERAAVVDQGALVGELTVADISRAVQILARRRAA